MEKIVKTRDLMALCRNVDTEGEEKQMNDLIGALARITYGYDRGLPEIGGDKSQNATSESTMIEYTPGVKNEMQSHLPGNEGEIVQGAGLGSDQIETMGWRKQRGGVEGGGMEKMMMAMEEGCLLPGGMETSKGDRAGEWSFLESDFHDENRKAKKRSPMKKMKEEPSKHFLRSSKTVFNQNRPVYQRTERVEILRRRVDLV